MPNKVLLWAILAPLTFIGIAVSNDYGLALWQVVLLSLVFGWAATRLERLIRWVFHLKAGEVHASPDLVTFALLFVSIGALGGFASSMVPAHYGLSEDDAYALRCIIMLLLGCFVFGLVRLVRHIVREELARAGVLASVGSEAPNPSVGSGGPI